MSAPVEPPALLRVLHGNPDPNELAVVTAVLLALGRTAAADGRAGPGGNSVARPAPWGRPHRSLPRSSASWKAGG